MAVTFTGVSAPAAVSGSSPQAATAATALAVGDFLVVLMAYDNSGGGGADPMSGTLSVTFSTGAVGASVSAQTGLNDPGAASAGLAARCVVFPVTVAIPSGASISISWSGTIVCRACSLMKVSSAAVTGYRTNHGATGTNSVNLANATAFVTPSVNSGEGVLCWTCEENGIALTGDADTTNGTWGSIYGGFAGTGVAGMAAYMQGKIVTATATQTFNPTGNATLSDWITGCLIFTETPVPAITQAAYRIYDDGTETGAVALAAQDTAANGDVISGDGIGQLRVRLQSTNAGVIPATDDWQLQWEKNANGIWTDVGANAVADTYDETNFVSANINVLNAGDVYGQSFLGDGGKLSRAGFYMQKSGTPPGNLTAVLYAHTGTFGSTGTGTGAVLATSTPRLGTSFNSPRQWEYFTFDGTYTLTAGVPYVIGYTIDTTTTGPNAVSTATDNTSSTHAGIGQQLLSGVWSTNASDRIFKVETAAAVLLYASPNTTDGAVTTNRLGAGTGSFVAGKVSEDGLVDNLGWSSNNYTELLFPLTIVKAQVVAGDVIRFRVLRNGVTTGMTYTAVPTINVVESTITQAAYRIYDDGTETGALPLAAQNTPAPGNITTGDGIGQLRVRLQSTSVAPPPATDDWQLQWEKNNSGTWANVVTTPPATLADNYFATQDFASSLEVAAGTYACAQSFTGSGGKLAQAAWRLVKNSAPPGNVYAEVYAHSGTFGTSSVPTGSPLATSTTKVASSLSTTYEWVTFDFDGTLTLAAGTKYVVVVTVSTIGTSPNYLSVGASTALTHAGNAAAKNSGGTWTASGVYDRCFQVYEKVAAVLPYASPNTTDGAATTNRLGAGTGSFVAGKISETGLVTDLGWSANNFTELLFPLTIVKPQVVAGDVIKLRVVRNGVTAGMTYTQVPQVDVVLGPVDYPGTISTNWGGWTATAIGTITSDHPGTISTDWGGWTATADGTVTTPPAAIAVSQLVNTLVTAPGANASSTAAQAHTTGHLYFASACQIRQVSTDPITPTPSGLGVTTWNLVVDRLWTASGTNRRRTTTWWGVATSTGSTAFTATYTANTPADINLLVLEVTGADTTNPVVQAVDTGTSGATTASSLSDNLPMSAFANSGNRAIQFADINTDDATLRLELNGDVGGGTRDWISFTPTLSASGPTNSHVAGWRDSAIADLSPGVMSADISAMFQLAIEVRLAGVGGADHPATIASNWGTWTATAVGSVQHSATVASNWGGWNALAVGSVTTTNPTPVLKYAGIIDENSTPLTMGGSTSAFSVTAGRKLVVAVGAIRAADVSEDMDFIDISASGYTFQQHADSSDGLSTNAHALAGAKLYTATVPSTNASQTIDISSGPNDVYAIHCYVWEVENAGFVDAVANFYEVHSTGAGDYTGNVNANYVGSIQASSLRISMLMTHTDPGDNVPTGGGWDNETFLDSSGGNPGASLAQWERNSTDSLVEFVDVAPVERVYSYAIVGIEIEKVAPDHAATIASNWGGWTATAIGSVSHPATVATSWGGWTGVSIATVTHPATIASSWGTWTATSIAAVTRLATVTTSWGGWTATAVGLVSHTATGVSTWGTWTATAVGVVAHPATIATSWGTWTATAVAVLNHPATIVTSWGTWTATAVAQPILHPATITSSWGTWTATASATVTSGAQTWSGSTAAIGVEGVSAAFIAAPITWVGGSTASVGVAGVSDVFVPAPVTWTSGSTAGVGVAAISGEFFQPGAQTWTGSTADIGVSGVSGTMVGNATVWIGGSTATVGVAGISAPFLAGAITWTGGSTAAVGVAGVSALFTGGATTWTGGSTAAVGVAGTSGNFLAGALTWAGGSTAEVGVVGVSAVMVGGPTTWAGSTAAVGVAGVSALMVGGPTTWVGSTASVGVAAVSALMVGGPTTWAGSTAVVGVAVVSAPFLAGGITWTGGSTAAVGIAGVSAPIVAGNVTWAGSTATIGVAGTSGAFSTPPPQTWTGSTATVGVAGESGDFASGTLWYGSEAEIGVAGTSGSFTAGAVTWIGSTAQVGVAAISAPFVIGAVTWAGSTATVGIAGISAPFVPSPITWVGSTADVGVAGVSGSFIGAAITWVGGSTAHIGVSGQSGTFVIGGAAWAGSTAEVGVAGVSGSFVGGATTWTTDSVPVVGVAGVSGAFTSGAVPWVGSPVEIGVEGLTGAFVPSPVTWDGSLAEVGVEGVSALMLGGSVTWDGSLAAVGVFAISGSFSSGIEGQWEGMTFDAMMYESDDVIEWMLVPA